MSRLVLFGLIVAAGLGLAVVGAHDDHPPHWFQSGGFSAYAGDTVEALDRDGDVIGSTTVSGGGWWEMEIDADHVAVQFRILAEGGVVQSPPLALHRGVLSRISAAWFTRDGSGAPPLGDTMEVRIIARRAEDGNIQFAVQDANGTVHLPRRNEFPGEGPSHHRWLRSTPVSLGDWHSAVIIARRAEDGRVEFALKVSGYPEFFPRKRYFPEEGPNHNRWLRSTPITIGEALAVAAGAGAD